MGTKIMAVVLAVFLWGFAYLLNLQDESITYDVKVSVEGNYSVDQKRRPVRIMVRGPRRTVEDLRLQGTVVIEKIITEEDLARFGEQDEIPFPLYIVAEDLNGQRGLTYPDIPKRVDLKISRIVTKTLSVDIRTTGQPKRPYVYSPEDSRVYPPQVRAKGPKSLLEQMEDIETEEVNINALFSERVEDARLALPAGFDSIQLEPERVRVRIAFKQQSSQETFENIPITWNILPDYPYRAVPSTPSVSVTVEGPKEVVATLDDEFISVVAIIDSSMVPRPTPYPQELHVWIRDHPQLKSTVEPDSISITVEER
jgi:hypothetical protein